MDVATPRVWIQHLSWNGSTTCGARLLEFARIRQNRRQSEGHLPRWTLFRIDVVLCCLTMRLPPKGMTQDEKKRLAIQSRNFCMLQDTLHHKGADDFWRRAIQQFEKEAMLCEAHCGIAQGHYTRNATTQKIWNNRLWRSTTMTDEAKYSKEYNLG